MVRPRLPVSYDLSRAEGTMTDSTNVDVAPAAPPVQLGPTTAPKASEVLANELRERILRGEFPQGTALPAERELVAQTRMSGTTVH